MYPKKYAHGFCFAVLCCGYTLTDFPISIRLTSLALWQSNDCPSASNATLMNMDKYFMWIHYERLHNHNKAKHNKTVHISWDILYHNPFDAAYRQLLQFPRKYTRISVYCQVCNQDLSPRNTFLCIYFTHNNFYTHMQVGFVNANSTASIIAAICNTAGKL